MGPIYFEVQSLKIPGGFSSPSSLVVNSMQQNWRLRRGREAARPKLI